MLRCTKRFSLVWSDVSKRPALLRVALDAARAQVLQPIPPFKGPASITTQGQRWAYHQPEQINETFDMAYKLLEQDAAAKYDEIAMLEQKLAQNPGHQGLQKRLDATRTAAEIHNPEVLYNTAMATPELDDLTQPVYRALAKKKWAAHDRMVTMQRIEQLHMIPDTMPTVDPVADVRVKFGHNTRPEFSDWVVPGTVLPGFATCQPPTVQVRQFEPVEGLYTVVVVNPDTPELATNSFSTQLHWGIANVALDNGTTMIDAAWQLREGASKTFKKWSPLVPEVNAGLQRACLWVFKQPGEISPSVSGDSFDIRAFAAQHGLEAVGGHIWRQQYDRLVPEIRQRFGLGAGRVFHRVRKADPVV